MQQEAIDVAQQAMSEHSIEKDIAMYIKKNVGYHIVPISKVTF